MKNLYLLPTDKPSRLFKFANQLHLDTIPKEYYKKYQIYITSDEEIKLGDWYFNNTGSAIEKLNNRLPSGGYFCKKIILTTDQDLIADGVEQISEDTLLKIVEHINSGKNIESFDKL